MTKFSVAWNMENYKELINSGLLELYVLGQTNESENSLVERVAVAHPEIIREIEAISRSLEYYALAHAIEPDPIIGPFLIATIDYTERLKNGEVPEAVPVLHEFSKSSNYQGWLDRPDMILPEDFENVFAKIISYTPELISAIVWIKEMAPQEVHDHEFERFLILEGSCDIHISGKVHQLVPGDYLQIPLHAQHHVVVTSGFPCKVLLQRVAA